MERLIPIITREAFAIKSEAGLAGYSLVSIIAKYLQYYSEQVAKAGILTQKDKDINQWYIESIHRLLTNKISGKGGKVGEEIIAELKHFTGVDVEKEIDSAPYHE